MEKFLKLFFNEGETFCVSPNKYAYQSVGYDSFVNNKVELISPNPDFLPITVPFDSMALMGLNPTKGFRNDDNCTAYRSFLVEIDTGTMEEQIQYIKQLRMPFSVCVFSGNKSLHYGIVLNEDLGSLENYKYTAKWLLSIVSKADQQTGPPSRCIRMPGVKRGEKMQELLELKQRISLDDLYSFLSRYPQCRPPKEQKYKTNTQIPSGQIPHWIEIALKDVNKYAAQKGAGRNHTWFTIFLFLIRTGMTMEEAIAYTIDHFEPEKDFKEREWLGIADSADKQNKRGIK